MNREIKFRAWHKPSKRMFDAYSFCRDFVFEDTLDGVWTSDTIIAKREDCELMQYTGLKDKNGDEIYEVDILRLVGDEPLGIMPANYVGVVVMINGSWVIDGCRPEQTLYRYIDFFEVVGNIYETPELLTKERL